ncbi:MAG: GNAT family N-acetyltransferase [Sphingobium sp.]|nr:GNAT family N-acetyltransferase [Sphingobium sp.]
MTVRHAHPPDWQPILVGETVLLRPTMADDWKEMYVAASDPLIWAVHPVRERYKQPLFRENFQTGLAGRMMLTIIERSTGAIIGTSRYHGHDPEKSEVEIGWTFLVRRHWGGRTNREVKRLMLDHAFRWVDCVYFRVGDMNWRSRGAMEKIGGKLREGLIEVVQNGVAMPYVVYEIRREDVAAVA